jgi:hypothetical protein
VALLFSCSSGPDPVPAVPLEHARTAPQLQAVLESIRGRTDVEASLARGRIYDRLRDLEGRGSPTLLAEGDLADMNVLSHGGSPEAKLESAGRLARHFRERAKNPVLSRSSFPGHLGEPLRQLVLATVATFFGDCATREERITALREQARAMQDFAGREPLSPDAVKILRDRAIALAAQADCVENESTAPDVSGDVRSFCEAEPTRHLEDGTRAADLGTREKADRANLADVLQWYLLALSHYAVVRETVSDLSPAQENALAAQDVVVRSLCDLVCREP